MSGTHRSTAGAPGSVVRSALVGVSRPVRRSRLDFRTSPPSGTRRATSSNPPSSRRAVSIARGGDVAAMRATSGKRLWCIGPTEGRAVRSARAGARRRRHHSRGSTRRSRVNGIRPRTTRSSQRRSALEATSGCGGSARKIRNTSGSAPSPRRRPVLRRVRFALAGGSRPRTRSRRCARIWRASGTRPKTASWARRRSPRQRHAASGGAVVGTTTTCGMRPSIGARGWAPVAHSAPGIALPSGRSGKASRSVFPDCCDHGTLQVASRLR